MSTNPVSRTERGLVVTGTRITLYEILDYRVAGWTLDRMADQLSLEKGVLTETLAWMDENRDLAARESEEVNARSRENRAYWEQRNSDRLASLSAGPNELRAKLEQRFGATRV